MKVISLLQPWATLVVIGAKQIETRSWDTKHRGELLIHASKKIDQQTMDMMEYEPFWQYLKEYWPADELYKRFSKLPMGAIIGKVNLRTTMQTVAFSYGDSDGIFFQKWGAFLNKQERAFGDYSDNRYGWLLSDPVQFKTPIPAKGSLGIWEFMKKL